MGLDVTELIMVCEEAFGIDFRKNQQALNEVETVGDLYRCILSELGRPKFGPDGQPWHDADVWNALRDIVSERLDVEKERVQLDSHFMKDLGAD